MTPPPPPKNPIGTVVPPRQAFASDGTQFNPDDDEWSFQTISGTVTLSFVPLRAAASETLLNAVKSAAHLLVTTGNLHTAGAAFRQCRNLIVVSSQSRAEAVEIIEPENVAEWCMRGYGAYVGQLQIFIKAWRSLHLDGVSADTDDFLKGLSFSPSTDKEAVRTWDPDAGAYRPAEDAALKAALDAAFNDGEVTLYDYALARVFRGLGMRPAQLAAMKVCDLRRTDARTEIRIPLAKQRGIPARGAFMPWKPITQGLADILFLHIVQNVLPRVPEGDDPDLAQLFPPKLSNILSTSSSVQNHKPANALEKNFSTVFRKLSVISPLTGRTIVVNPQRERHTVLTGLAMNGCNALEIAANAGHASAESCQAYVDASMDHYQRMERLVGEAFIPIADRFLGKVVREHVDEKAQDDPNSVLFDKSMTGVGSCEIGRCKAVDAGVAPVACYTCRKFRAWADAPHEVILSELLKQQRDLNQAGHAEVAETKNAPILAITDLLEAIKQRTQQNG